MAEHPLLEPLLRGDRRALARAITLIESTRPEDRDAISLLIAQTQARAQSGAALRLGISGPPGAGKSTLIESLGMAAIAQGRRVAVLAVDPSSSISGGSILGDKTRMGRLAVHAAAFIRPSPAGSATGGVASRTREAMQLCEAAGYDVVLVETVGAGQAETAVAQMADLFLLLQLPNSGDELQAIKRGAMELADIVVVNKADLDPQAAQRAAMQLGGATGARRVTPVVSALTGEGIEALWQEIEARAEMRRASGAYQQRRNEQSARAVPSRADGTRPFRVLGVQQIAIGGEDRLRLRHLWVQLLGLQVTGAFVSEEENVDEEICALGDGAQRVEIDLMQPLDPQGKPAVHQPPLNHIGLWVDDLHRAMDWLQARGLRFAPGGIRRGAGGHETCFIHPRAGGGFPLGGEGVLIELVQAPAQVIAASTPPLRTEPSPERRD